MFGFYSFLRIFLAALLGPKIVLVFYKMWIVIEAINRSIDHYFEQGATITAKRKFY